MEEERDRGHGRAQGDERGYDGHETSGKASHPLLHPGYIGSFVPILNPICQTGEMPAVETNHYAVLGVSPKSSLKELREAYRRLARAHHPDLNRPNGAGDGMARVNEAWRVLSNPDTRRRFDRGIGVGGTPAASTQECRGQDWASEIRVQILRLGHQAGDSATQSLLLGSPLGSRDSYDAVLDSILSGLQEDTEARVRSARAAGAHPLDLGTAAAMVGIRSLADRLRRQSTLGVRADMVMEANLLDRMWDVLAYELPNPLPQRLGGNPAASATVRF